MIPVEKSWGERLVVVIRGLREVELQKPARVKP
jgi:hypothetical protein